MTMQRMKMMTLGFVLVMFGLQLNLVESFELTPRFSTFLSEHGSDVSPSLTVPQNNQNPYAKASFDRNAEIAFSEPASNRLKVIKPPKWLCWPTMFLGSVLVLQGAIRKD